MTYTSDSTGTVYEGGKVFATVHPGQGDVAEEARRVAIAQNTQALLQGGMFWMLRSHLKPGEEK